MLELIILYFIYKLSKTQPTILNKTEAPLINDIYGIWENNNIEEITGISHLTKLKWLDLSFNKIKRFSHKFLLLNTLKNQR